MTNQTTTHQGDLIESLISSVERVDVEIQKFKPLTIDEVLNRIAEAN